MLRIDALAEHAKVNETNLMQTKRILDCYLLINKRYNFLLKYFNDKIDYIKSLLNIPGQVDHFEYIESEEDNKTADVSALFIEDGDGNIVPFSGNIIFSN